MTSRFDFFAADEAEELVRRVGARRAAEALARLRLEMLGELLKSLRGLHSESWRAEVFAFAESEGVAMACLLLGFNHRALVDGARQIVDGAKTTRPDGHPRGPGAGRPRKACSKRQRSLFGRQE